MSWDVRRDMTRDMARKTDEQSAVEKHRCLDSAFDDATTNCFTSTKLRVLCLHGFRTSGKIMADQLAMANWHPLFDDIAELVFIDAPCPATGQATVEKHFAGPYFEWVQMSEDYEEMYGFDKATKHFSDSVSLHGPFDGLLGFSQGAVLAAAWMGLYESGHSMGPDLKSIKFLILVGGGRDISKTIRHAYNGIINCPSLHLIGDKCFMKPFGEAPVSVFKEPVVIKHPFGHVIPKLGAPQGQIVRKFFLRQLQRKIAADDRNSHGPARSLL